MVRSGLRSGRRRSLRRREPPHVAHAVRRRPGCRRSRDPDGRRGGHHRGRGPRGFQRQRGTPRHRLLAVDLVSGSRWAVPHRQPRAPAGSLVRRSSPPGARRHGRASTVGHGRAGRAARGRIPGHESGAAHHRLRSRAGGDSPISRWRARPGVGRAPEHRRSRPRPGLRKSGELADCPWILPWPRGGHPTGAGCEPRAGGAPLPHRIDPAGLSGRRRRVAPGPVVSGFLAVAGRSRRGRDGRGGEPRRVHGPAGGALRAGPDPGNRGPVRPGTRASVGAVRRGRRPSRGRTLHESGQTSDAVTKRTRRRPGGRFARAAGRRKSPDKEPRQDPPGGPGGRHGPPRVRGHRIRSGRRLSGRAVRSPGGADGPGDGAAGRHGGRLHESTPGATGPQARRRWSRATRHPPGPARSSWRLPS